MRTLRNLLLTATALVPIGALPAFAGPNGGTVVGGSANIQNPGSANVTINQFSDKAIINWNLFNIGVGEKTTFVQPNSGSIALNRVVGGLGPSEILGTLNANGRVFVVNRDGIIFGAGAVVNTAGFLATTSDIKNEDFMAGRFNFQIPGKPDASIVNMGTITASSGGFAALVAPGVRNSGTITANLGTVVLGAGNIFNLDFYGDRLITLGIGDQIASQVKDVATGQTLKSLVTNEGKLKANGGRVELTAAAARQVVDSVINTSGVIEANSVGTHNGQIVLSAATAASKGDAPAQKVQVSGTLSAAGKRTGTKGGSIIVTGENIEVAGATIDASGRDGGGKVLIGGDWGGGKPDKSLVVNQSAKLESSAIPTATTVSVDAATRIDASAKDRGDGGKVVLWSDQTTSFAGTILALGGKEIGNGGFVETSGKGLLNFTGNVDTRAPNGTAGTLLLDPADTYIDTSFITRPPGSTEILTSTIVSQLNGGNVVIATNNNTNPVSQNGDIFVTGQVNWNTNNSLSLIAFRNIQISDTGANGTLKNTAGGSLILHADSTGTGVGTVTMPASTFSNRVDWSGSTGTISVFYNPSSYSSPTNFTTGNGHIQTNAGVPGQLTAYMLVNNDRNLQDVNQNTSGNYALGRDIPSFTNIPNFAPIQTFTGIFDGLGHTISNLHVAPTTPSNFGIGVGLFAAIGATGVVRNVNFDNASVTANPNVTGPGQFVGILAGNNAGTISNVTITNSTVSNGTATHGVIAGGLVGQNGDLGPGGHLGTITLVNVAANVTVGSSSDPGSGNSAGGIAGDNPGTITLSSASGNITGGANSFIGGLAGRNESTATISSSTASGNVNLTDATAAGAGGAVGFNFGTLNIVGATGNVTGGNSSDIFRAGSVGGLVGMNDPHASITTGVATGNVSGGSNVAAGGLVAFNNGTITGSVAGGTVSSLDNSAGGLVAFNGTGATITASFATGNVSGGGINVGGFVGDNAGTITGSGAGGNVTGTSTGSDGSVGGFVGNNVGSISGSFAIGNVTGQTNAGGFAGSNGSNGGSINNSFAGVPGVTTVTVGNNGTAGGFVGGNTGQITNSMAFGAVTGGSNSALGGFAAGNLDGKISDSAASGAVSSTGPNSIVGGFAGANGGSLVRVSSSGPVSGTSESFLGGLVGFNIALIQDSTSTSTVTGSGSHNIAGGLVGANFGLIDPSQSSGNVSSGANSVVGGFVGVNGALQFPGNQQLIGAISTDSSGTGSPSGGSGSTTGAQVGQTFPTSGLPSLPTIPCNGSPLCGGTLFNPFPVVVIPTPTPTPIPTPIPTPTPTPTPTPPQQQQDNTVTVAVNVPAVSPLLNIAATLVNDVVIDKKPDLVITNQSGPTGGPAAGQGGGGSPGGQKGGANPGGARPPANVVAAFGLGALPSGMPPLNETRFRNDEAVFQLGANLSQDDIILLTRQLGLQILYQEKVELLGRTVLRVKLPEGATVRGVIATFEQKGANFSGQPSYQYEMVQDVAQAPSPADTNRKGDSAQYIVEKLGLPEAHLVATGKDVKVAVIDSEIDANHPDLQGAVTGSYDALPSDDQSAHPHGTGMAGAIASHKRLLGIAPNARLLAVRAFGINTGGAQGTSLNIVKGLQWAVDQGAKIINMSFAGPRDPILQQAIKRLTDQGIILIAAAGNAGPKSPPLFPGADPNVIAVSATDVDDKTYKGANRGKYIAIAAPGVDILVPAPDGGYQLTTGTSVAAAHISGVVALMLERNKELKPAEVRSILSATAKNIGGVKTDVGAGLVDPVQALAKSGPKSAQLQ